MTLFLCMGCEPELGSRIVIVQIAQKDEQKAISQDRPHCRLREMAAKPLIHQDNSSRLP